MYTYLFDLT